YHSKLTSVCTLFATQNHRQTRDLFPPADSTLVNPPAAKLHHHQHPPTSTATTNTTATKAPSSSSSSTNQPTHDPTKLPAMEDWLAKYENHFNHHLSMLLRGLDYYAATETVALGRLCAQLSAAGETGGRERIAGAGVRE
ncbi:MAG: hypothetical protein LQ349_009904, partial [Xanthoria aureola]